ncbi:uncharacterized protein BYT42DRAFT_505161 [Radiomyces spectabilis]|uniref:uncharacterized protein n=1 Tax=Radiomyces spectabilis TaxID=64574 RepID=UPI002220D945|nr:uncharacterized protein BYT42DRAFT_505161 [Radiomyces spectabilis]KAI8366114.1 hypothetical protein BYT42DRAFT_505161 [Radiomyces spectabilis]
MTADDSLGNVLVLGGVGVIGRHFVQYILDKKLADDVRVVDKMLPQTAFLSAEHKLMFEKVDFKQSNLINPDAIASCFDRDDGREFDCVFNFAGEPKYSQSPEVYEKRIYMLSVNCAKEAVKRNVKAFIEMSSCEVYGENEKPSDEMAKIKPWTAMAKYKYKVEEALRAMPGLNLVVLRSAFVYGPGTYLGLTPRLIMGRIYKYLNEEMKLLWSGDLKMNTVHIDDVVKACWYTARWYIKNKKYQVEPKEAITFNLVDKQDTDQEFVNGFLRDIYNIQTGYYNTLICTFAKMNLSSITDDINEKHLAPWAKLLEKSKIVASPLSPYLDEEFLQNHSLHADGTKIESIGFTYSYPYITRENVIRIIDDFKAQGLWPQDD